MTTKPENTNDNKQIIYIHLEGGIVHDIKDIPPGIEIKILDYDVEGMDKEHIQISPVNEEACLISTFP